MFITKKELEEICTKLNIEIKPTKEKYFDREYAMKEAIKKTLLIDNIQQVEQEKQKG